MNSAVNFRKKIRFWWLKAQLKCTSDKHQLRYTDNVQISMISGKNKIFKKSNKNSVLNTLVLYYYYWKYKFKFHLINSLVIRQMSSLSDLRSLPHNSFGLLDRATQRPWFQSTSNIIQSRVFRMELKGFQYSCWVVMFLNWLQLEYFMDF